MCLCWRALTLFSGLGEKLGVQRRLSWCSANPPLPLCFPAVDVTLDPDTAYPSLILSDNLRQVRYSYLQQDLPDNPERFNLFPCVLGSPCFIAGRHYWEVEVGDKAKWTIGVCEDSVCRKGGVTSAPQNGFWAVSLWYGKEYWALTSPMTALPLRTPLQRVGIFLDYDAGEVSFYNVTERCHTFTFSHATFCGPVRPYFSLSYSGGKSAAPLIICPMSGIDGFSGHVGNHGHSMETSPWGDELGPEGLLAILPPQAWGILLPCQFLPITAGCSYHFSCPAVQDRMSVFSAIPSLPMKIVRCNKLSRLPRNKNHMSTSSVPHFLVLHITGGDKEYG